MDAGFSVSFQTLSLNRSMKLSDLREHWEIIRDEALALESTYIQELPRPTGKWVANDPGGEIWKILKKYQDGESGWLKSGKMMCQVGGKIGSITHSYGRVTSYSGTVACVHAR